MPRKIFSPTRLRVIIIPVVLVLAIAIAITARTNRQAPSLNSNTGQNSPALLAPAAAGGLELQATQGPPNSSVGRPQAGELTRPVSFNGDLRKLPHTGPPVKKPMVELKRFAGQANSAPSVQDPVVQSSQGSASMPTPSIDFAGLDLNTWGAGWPPDTNGDVGALGQTEYYIQTVNTSIGVYSTTTGSRLAAFTFNTFFNGTNTPCDSSNQGDPVVVFDVQSGRWIITDFAWTNFVNGPYYQCIAVSKTGDPILGGW
jgi:hypothetical protein